MTLFYTNISDTSVHFHVMKKPLQIQELIKRDYYNEWRYDRFYTR